MNYGSVCSGIEAATVAWHTLGFKPLWFSEIEKFPNAVLEHHYPEIPNLGDMTKITAKIKSGEVEAPDILVGGTPCQAFSMAGLRNSLDDNRGQLTLEFVRLANAIDTARSIQGKPACIIVWENVPGVLNTKDNAFGCFLGGLSGERGELHSPGRKWTNTGYVLGPERQVAWRTLDAQFFGLAQRRKRVFVIASARAECIAEILFERKGMSGNNQTSGSEKKDTAKRSVRSIISTGANTTLSGKDTLSPILASNGQKMWLGNQEAFSGDYHIKQVISAFKPIGMGGLTVNAAIGRNLFPTLLARKEADGYVVHGIQENVFVNTAYSMVADTTPKVSKEINATLRSSGGGGIVPSSVSFQTVARYLTEIECERLQGFPDNYTNIPKASKSNRYKALGNSMAVPVMQWIGKRLVKNIG
ncbi:DNA cytosine methyltransferase [Acinetobacter pollinis]|uniref:DNA (cytosine-5-)-methyltransferase n=1 Tax=Acinetobacter pollinis TaxID=2605270 RepID=A0ABU6DXI5_9GAMM|nr:DNA cytosine methyltransferase [Acinetobacter pollinis]MEB5477607.1 DNA cytosine methyltransferase [Acinetobacter pollinis]